MSIAYNCSPEISVEDIVAVRMWGGDGYYKTQLVLRDGRVLEIRVDDPPDSSASIEEATWWTAEGDSYGYEPTLYDTDPEIIDD